MWYIFLIIFLILIVNSRAFNAMAKSFLAQRIIKKYDIDLRLLEVAFEQVVWFISVPTSDPDINNCGLSEFRIELVYDGIIYPEVKGLNIFVYPNQTKKQIAYLSTENFRCYHVEKLLEKGVISNHEYNILSTYKCFKKDVLEAVTMLVFEHLNNIKIVEN